ncbi:MAG: hypothetical protein P8H32_04625 [Oceanicoccus sp.]|uniref:hypothetical protein n=1 Tax=Oceanicoccus sp. TaxID=2691044 RepID=UPI0026225B4E|nr:hypothetical protein [Oceanicoccus sp.]MDG1772705.1 hypothetical protein [Oceanicoccus sp.]
MGKCSLGLAGFILFATQVSASDILTADFETGEEGDSITEFHSLKRPENATYSTEVAGPYSGEKVLKIEQKKTEKYFGGKIANVDLGEGKEIWVRWYQFFPEDFAFANGVNGDDLGGAGSIKWLRFQYPGVSERITLLMDATYRCYDPCTDHLNSLVPEKFVGELQGWKERYGSTSAVYIDKENYPLGEWHAMQVYLKLSKGSSDKGDGNGLIRMWMDDKLIAEFQRNTMPVNGGALRSIWLGDYWNGGFPKDQHWFIDHLDVSTEQPVGTDSHGNYFIVPISNAPMPPSSVRLD